MEIIECHVRGMLDRDQRTAKMIPRIVRENHQEYFYCDGCLNNYNHHHHHHHRNTNNNNAEDNRRTVAGSSSRGNSHVSHVKDTIPGRTNPSGCRIREKESGDGGGKRFWVTLTRVHRAVVLCFYLTLFALPTTIAAPIRMEKWMMPCGQSERGSNLNREDLLQTIIDQSRRSLVKMETFRDRFAMSAFGNNWTEVQEYQGGIGSLTWFPKIEKEIGKPLTQDKLNKLKLNDLLKDTYQYLQIIAVAVDQMINEEEQRRGPLVEDYKTIIESYVRSVLCEMQTASNALKVTRHRDVERTIIPAKDKNGDNTTMMTRHYLIIRDYLRLLEYIIECYEHVKANP